MCPCDFAENSRRMQERDLFVEPTRKKNPAGVRTLTTLIAGSFLKVRSAEWSKTDFTPNLAFLGGTVFLFHCTIMGIFFKK